MAFGMSAFAATISALVSTVSHTTFFHHATGTNRCDHWSCRNAGSHWGSHHRHNVLLVVFLMLVQMLNFVMVHFMSSGMFTVVM